MRALRLIAAGALGVVGALMLLAGAVVVAVAGLVVPVGVATPPSGRANELERRDPRA